ncbi:FAD-dependent oxidoreductase [Roseateles sp. DAIF2]|uniref:FAD-dependent oxidoreductase n=1 Tax=Roseateles sp. DAIF2 TaxID=2714952 RepID=UPI0018A2BD3C|nr:FAD-dependent oxidoreductase [Roseateles sp. DAIF2]QPF75685.1 FAD-dependent oxidoreductase [Roseateles sp. DAIF2]
MAKIAIAGAGLAGRLLAWALARAGHAVQVFDPAPGPEPRFDGQGAAAFTAAGMLSPLAEQECGGGAEVARLGWDSLALWPAIVAALPAPAPRLRVDGSLLLAHGADRGAAARALARMPGAQALTPAELRELEPALAPSGLLAWLLPGEGLIHPVEAMAALQRGAAAVRWHWGRRVEQVLPGRLHFGAGQAALEADWCVDARGLGARPPLPLRGVRGEVIALQLPDHGLRRPLRLLHPRHRVYLVPRSAHELVIGASEIESEDRSPVSLQSAVELMAAAHSLLPALGEARITRLDRNLRPALPDNLPFTHLEPGLMRLNGLYRHGWLLAPALVQRLLAASGLASLEHPR